ncbi:hypothetical protein [Rhizobium oryzicola]|uniref:Uncharacterized protein n=1 Tax=Rhizobium oryzicola TaxID=1232668 RepID=A0ABT8SYD1_9HYPH|nr:hypothetical protein [Rhizobium oryzicola]MDO1582981.1 hypothetical protein [Rhizobium oryzicola]
MAEHLGEAASNGKLNVGGGNSSVGYKVTARKQDGGKVKVAISVMAPRDWLLKQGFKQDATLVRANGGELAVRHTGGELDVSDSISVTLSAAEVECDSEEQARQAFPELELNS